MKSIFWSGGWTRTIDLQGPSPGALPLSYRSILCSLSSQTDVTPNKKQRRGIIVPLTKSKSNLWEMKRDSNPHQRR